MKRIKLTQDKYALVDNEDFKKLSVWKWTYDRGYARRNENGVKVYMHRYIMSSPTGVVDHINRNPLDNRKENLRISDKSKNALNSGLWRHNKSGFKGVSWSKSAKKWLSRIQYRGKVIHFGLFKNIRDAINARVSGEKKLNI